MTKKMHPEEFITPAVAKQYLQKNAGNRKLQMRTVDSYATQMTQGEWHFVGDTIVFDNKGKLRNGQHRLHAIIASGKPMKTIVVRGVEPEAFAFMDALAAKTAGDALSVLGMPEGRKLETSIRMIMGIHEHTRRGDPGKRISMSRPTRTKTLEFAKKWRSELKSITEFVMSLDAKQSLGLSKSAIIALIFAIENVIMVEFDDEGQVSSEYFVSASKKTSKKVRNFFAHLSRGDGLESDSPILQLRSRLLTSLTHSKKLATSQKLTLVVHTWNSIVMGKDPKLYGMHIVNRWPEIFWPEDLL